MRSKRRLVVTFAVLLGVMTAVAVALAPSWRNYHLHRGGLRIIEDVAYVTEPADAKHRLDLYLPPAGVRPWPAVVFVHGGFWRPFDRRMFQAVTGLHGCAGVALANRGVGTAVISYRQRPEAASLQDALDDIAHATRYVLDHVGLHGGDPQRVYIVGHSAGGLFTALLGVQPEHLAAAGVAPGSVRGFAMLGSVYDLQRLISFSPAGLADKVRSSANAGDLARYSPQRHIGPGAPPMLLLVGGDEEPAMIAEQRQMAAALRAAGGEVTAAELTGVSHMGLVMDLFRPGNQALDELLRFIERRR